MNSKSHLVALKSFNVYFLGFEFTLSISFSQSVFHKGMKTHLEDFESQTWNVVPKQLFAHQKLAGKLISFKLFAVADIIARHRNYT